jgi:anti-anti-sigma factor
MSKMKMPVYREAGLAYRVGLAECLLAGLTPQQFGQGVIKLIDRNPKPRVVLSLVDIDYVSSATLGVLLNIRKHIDAAEGQIRISNLAPPVREIFHVTGLVHRFEIHADHAAALASFND